MIRCLILALLLMTMGAVPGGNIAITLVDLSAVARNVRLTLHGFKANPRLQNADVYTQRGRS